MLEYPKMLYRDGDLSKDAITVEDQTQETQGNADGFFFYVTHRDSANVQNADEGQAPTEEEVIDRATLRAMYADRFGKPAPGAMSDDSLRSALGLSDV